METEEILAEIRNADMVLVGLGEEFDDTGRLRDCSEYLKGKELLQESEYSWLIPAWNEYCSARMKDIVSPALKKLADILRDKNYFVVVTATDNRIAAASWRKGRLVMPCGTTGRKQCTEDHSHMVEDVTVKEKEQLNDSFSELFEGYFPSDGMAELTRCSQCGAAMVLNHIYTENYNEQGYMEQWRIYTKWLQGTLNHRLLVLELGVGMRFPSVIRWPFEKITYFNNKAFFIRVNEKLYQLTEELSGKGCGIPKNAIAWLERL